MKKNKNRPSIGQNQTLSINYQANGGVASSLLTGINRIKGLKIDVTSTDGKIKQEDKIIKYFPRFVCVAEIDCASPKLCLRLLNQFESNYNKAQMIYLTSYEKFHPEQSFMRTSFGSIHPSLWMCINSVLGFMTSPENAIELCAKVFMLYPGDEHFDFIPSTVYNKAA